MSRLADTQLVIFDCDGVLIDSEIISANVLRKILANLDIHVETERVFKMYLGHSFNAVLKDVAELTGKPPPENLQRDYETELFASMKKDVLAIEGVADVLKNLEIPYCVATSSNPHRAKLSLETAGLFDHFTDRLFSATMVPNGKPAPDLFLHAASQMRVPLDRCLVIEDSPTGILAANHAGIPVWRFTGGTHITGENEQAWAGLKIDRTFAHMSEFFEQSDLRSKPNGPQTR